MFIEKSLLLNGYAFTPAGDGMVKILAFDAKKPTMEGAPLIDSPMELPMTDQVVSHVVNLKYLNSEDATKAIDQVIPRHSYGVITPVPNAKALVITENSNTIRYILELLVHMDVEPSRTEKRSFQLTRASAEDVAEALAESQSELRIGWLSYGTRRSGCSPSGERANLPIQG
jgi:type II secretory pathway component GspD/PulD (secretin)